MNGSTVGLLAAVGLLGLAGAASAAPDLIIHNGKILTVDAKFSQAQAAAIEGERFVTVGDDAKVLATAGKGTRVIDLKGKTVLPGFNDTHSHMVLMGVNLLASIDLTEVKSIADIQRKIASGVAAVKPGEWVFSEGGWWQFMLSDGRLPTRLDLDVTSPNNPVVLRAGHYFVVNTAALKAVGFTRGVKDPPGGEIVRDTNGDPTGMVVRDARNPFLKYVPAMSRQQQLDGIRKAMKRVNSWGMTSLREAGNNAEQLALLRELYDKSELTVRVDWAHDVDPNTPLDRLEQTVKALGPPGQKWGNLFRADTFAEVFLDGAEESGFLRGTYQGRPDYHGIQVVPQEQLNKFAAVAARYGWRLSPHSVGDAAIDEALTAFEYANSQTPITDRRWMIDHAILMQPDQYNRVKKLGLIVNAQPRHIFIIGDKFVEFWGQETANKAYNMRDWIDNGIMVTLGADRPISFRGSPLMQIYIAVTRRTGVGGTLNPGQAITREEAIRAITQLSAYTSFDEKEKGSIEAGKLADFVVLGQDILTVDAEAIKDIRVHGTVLGGKVVYGSL